MKHLVSQIHHCVPITLKSPDPLGMLSICWMSEGRKEGDEWVSWLRCLLCMRQGIPLPCSVFEGLHDPSVLVPLPFESELSDSLLV